MKTSSWKKIMICAVILLLAVATRGVCVQAEDSYDISAFLGRYLCDVPDTTENTNPDIMELYFKDDGALTRYSGLFYEITGTTTLYEYTDYKIEGNTLTCYYDCALSSDWEPRSDIPAGAHEYIMDEDGNISAEGHIWYSYKTDEEKKAHPDTLMSVVGVDFKKGSFSETASFLGMPDLKRSDIEEVDFLDSLDQKPESAWDVSQDRDGSVYAWVDSSGGTNHVYIASGDGRIYANADSGYLFYACTNLKRISFSSYFYTGQVEKMHYMFADCKSLLEIDGLEQLNMENVSTMEGMFYGCSCLNSIDIDNLPLSDQSSFEDIFTDTVREGDSPLLSEERNKRVVTSYILDSTYVTVNDSSMRAKVINSYDDKLKEFDESWEDGLQNMMYAIEDITGDGMPDLIIECMNPESYRCFAYTYNVEKGKMEHIKGFDFSCSSYDLYFFDESLTLAYYDNDNYHLCTWQDNQFVETSAITVSELQDMKNGEALEFRYGYPDLIWTSSSDADDDLEDSEDEVEYDFKVYGIKGKTGYISAAFYADSSLMFIKNLESINTFDDIDLRGQMMSDGTIWFCMRLYTGSTTKYCGILRYKAGHCEETMNILDAVREFQVAALPSGNNYFEIRYAGDSVGDISLTFHLDTIAYGSDFGFSMDYQYSDGKLIQRDYLRPIERISADSFILLKDKNIFQNIADKKVKFKAEAGTTLIPYKVWFANGLIWLQVTDSDGRKGWVPMGGEAEYMDLPVFYKAVDMDAEMDYFCSSLIPDGEELYRLAEENYNDGDYDNTVLYCRLIKILNVIKYLDAKSLRQKAEQAIHTEWWDRIETFCEEEAYEDAYRLLIYMKEYFEKNKDYQEYVRLCREKLGISEDDSSSVEVGSDLNTDTVAEAGKQLLHQVQAMNINEEHSLAYCTVDMDQDGIAEIILRSYTPEASEGGAYVYSIFQFDNECGRFRHLSSSDFYSFAIENAVYYWEEEGYLVLDESMGEYYYELYTLNDGRLNLDHTASNDMTYLPALEFTPLDFSSGEELNAYRDFLSNGQHLMDVRHLNDLSYSICDLDGDGICELVIKGVRENDSWPEYWFYSCEQGEVDQQGYFDNSLNVYSELYMTEDKGICADKYYYAGAEEYSGYDIKNGLEKVYSVTKKAEDSEQGTDTIYEYCTDDHDGKSTVKVTNEEQWNSFVNSLVEIPFVHISWQML